MLNEQGQEIELRELDDEMDLSDRDLEIPTLGGAELAKPMPDAQASPARPRRSPKASPMRGRRRGHRRSPRSEELEKVAGALKNPVAGRPAPVGRAGDDEQELEEEDLFDEGDEELRRRLPRPCCRRLSDDFDDEEE